MKKIENVEVQYVKKSTMAMVAAGCLAAGLIAGFLLHPLLFDTAADVRSYREPAATAVTPQPAAETTAAIEQLETRTQADPEDADAWKELGNAYFDSGQFLKAIGAYEKYLEMNPDNPDVWTDLGIMYRRSGQPQKAITCFDKAMEADPQHQQSRFNKGVVLMHDLNDTPGAIAAWEALLEVNPDATAPNGMSVQEMLERLQAAVPQ